MREILFRGKVKNAPQTEQYELDYVHGNLIKELETGRTFIVDLGYFETNTKLNEILIEVIPETIGQYTGLKDKNGKKIFEGDIVYLHQTVNGYSQFIIAYLDYKFIPIYYNEKTKRPTRRFYEYDLDEFFEIGECEREIEVIGNIF